MDVKIYSNDDRKIWVETWLQIYNSRPSYLPPQMSLRSGQKHEFNFILLRPFVTYTPKLFTSET
jgi:hypothetical protein